jgi:hypothetical protein
MVCVIDKSAQPVSIIMVTGMEPSTTRRCGVRAKDGDRHTDADLRRRWRWRGRLRHDWRI